MILPKSLREEPQPVIAFGRDGKQLLHLNVNDTRTILSVTVQGPLTVTLKKH